VGPFKVAIRLEGATLIGDGNPSLSKSGARGWVCWVERGSSEGDSRFAVGVAAGAGAEGGVATEPAATEAGTEIR
jgi:hypothetical protein